MFVLVTYDWFVVLLEKSVGASVRAFPIPLEIMTTTLRATRPGSGGTRDDGAPAPAPDQASRETLVDLIDESLHKGHRKVAAQRILILLYRFKTAPAHHVDALMDILRDSTPWEIRRNGRVSRAVSDSPSRARGAPNERAARARLFLPLATAAGLRFPNGRCPSSQQQFP